MAQSDHFAGFVIYPIFHVKVLGVDLAFTNSALFMLVTVVSVLIFFRFALKKEKLVPGKMQYIAESAYHMILEIIESTIGPKGRGYLSLIITIFFFILLGNLTGYLPGGLSYTTHIVVTMALAFILFIFIVLLGFFKHGFHFFKIFIPSGTPKGFIPLIFILEFVSYFIRPFTLSIRLTANMVVGHLLLETIGSFIITIGIIFGIIPFLFLFPVIVLELIVSFIQAYVFTVLICIYLGESINLKH